MATGFVLGQGIEWQGLGGLQKILDTAPSDAIKAAKRVLFREGEKIMTDSKQRFVPVDLGELKDSGFVDKPVVKPFTQTVSVTLGFGGIAKAYALIQHENLGFKHKTGGPKYLERPVDLAAKRVSRNVGQAIGRAIT